MLLPLALARGRLPGAVLAPWRPLVAFAVIEIMVPWLLLGVAEQQLSSSLTGLLIASVPLVGAVLAVATRSDDRLDGGGWPACCWASPASPRWSASRSAAATSARWRRWPWWPSATPPAR